jgi:hypothetical protein
MTDDIRACPESALCRIYHSAIFPASSRQRCAPFMYFMFSRNDRERPCNAISISHGGDITTFFGGGERDEDQAQGEEAKATP